MPNEKLSVPETERVTKYWCRNCSHYTEPLGENPRICRWCHSDQIGVVQASGIMLTPNENSGRGKTFEQQHDVKRQTQYPEHYRLARGFAILNGGSV